MFKVGTLPCGCLLIFASYELLSRYRDTQHYLRYHHTKCIGAITDYVQHSLDRLSSLSSDSAKVDQGRLRLMYI